MNSFGLSDKGQYRAENQDSFEITPIGDCVLAVVCDGMGGAAAGYLAGEMAAARFTAHARASLNAEDGSGDARTLREAAEEANRKVYHFSCESEEYAGMGSTLVAGIFRPGEATVVNIGDSRAYRIAKDGLVQLTKDHSLVQAMVERGELTPAQAKRHPKRNLITRAVGTDAFVDTDIFEVAVRDGDYFLLCSDGLTNAVDDAEIHRLVLAADTAETACCELVKTALRNNARDNVTVVVIGPVEGGGENG